MTNDLLTSALDRYLSWGWRMYPLRAGTKLPMHKGYKVRKYGKLALVRLLESGVCVGLGRILEPWDLVIDVDPRHEGSTGLECLLGLIRLPDLALVAPTVNSGGQDHGVHYYFRLPRDFVKPLKSVLPDCPGLEFKHSKQTITVPLSLHPDTGRPYLHDPSSPALSAPALAPVALLDLLVKTPRQTLRTAQRPQEKSLSGAELRSLLDQLPVEEYADNDAWLRILMASHHATQGSDDGLESFLAWSLGDPCYQDQEETIRQRWASLDPAASSAVTVATLHAEIDKRNPENAIRTLINEAKKAGPNASYDQMHLLTERARSLSPGAYQQVCSALASKLGTSKQELKRLLKETKKDLKPSPVIVLTDYLKNVFWANANIVSARNQQFYEYNGKNWAPLLHNMLLRRIREGAESLGDEYPKLPNIWAGMLSQIQNQLISLTAVGEDIFRFTSVPAPVFNCQNGEVWVFPDKIDFRPHNPESYLLHCLPIYYDPDATCSRFDRALVEIFGADHFCDPDDLVRHLWEIFGYISQPKKNLPAYFVWKGFGRNGKTFLAKILSTLIGEDNVLAHSISHFGDSSDNHITSSLPGKLLLLDDDADIHQQLPESALKKLAEDKLWECNPKHNPKYSFRSTASPLVLTNDWPSVRDLSYGMWRKAYVLEFKRTFEGAHDDTTLADKIVATEMPGVLNRALEGYLRLQKRGHFQVPLDCRIALEKWLQISNPIVGFVKARCDRAQSQSSTLHDLYLDYRSWCHTAGLRFPLQLTKFELAMLQLGYAISDATIPEKKVVSGLGLKN